MKLRTITGVELAKVGMWRTVSHPDGWTITRADLESAVAAHRAGVLPRPRLKIGHTDPRFDGGPALGRVDNLRLADGGNTLVGDFVDVPAAIAALLPAAYPSRSVEAVIDYEAADGSVWPLILRAVALLGEAAAGIESLADIADLHGVDLAAAGARRGVLAAATITTGRTAPDVRARAVAVARARRTRSAQSISTERIPT